MKKKKIVKTNRKKRRVDRSIPYWKTSPELTEDKKLKALLNKHCYDIKEVSSILQKNYDLKTPLLSIFKQQGMIHGLISKQYQKAIDANE